MLPSLRSQPSAGLNPPIHIPHFTVERMYYGWWDSLKILFARVPLSRNPVRLFRAPAWRRTTGRSLTGSLVLHGSFILFLVYLHRALPTGTPPEERPSTSERIFYRVPVLDSSKVLPRITPAGVGGRPGNAAQPAPPILGSTALLRNVTAVSKPLHPDNNRQTILQRTSPPDLRIPDEVKLPMIALGNPDIPKPAIKIDPHDSKAIQVQRRYATEAAPSESETNFKAIVPLASATVPQPQLPIPAGEASKPVQRGGGNRAVPAAPDVQGNGDNDLFVMSVDPSGPLTKIALPAGNRYGDFSLSPAGGSPGSPAGDSNAVKAGGGSGAEGAGGEGSVGIGAGKSGGGGDSSGSLPISLTGRGTAPASNGVLPPASVEEMIVPVITTPHVRRNALVVSGGPIGGAGLGVYKALNCGKIYTIFITMPGTDWSLEYCRHSDPGEPSTSATSEAPRTVVHLEQPVLPPDATVKFDFLRLPVSDDKKRKLIVLKGVIDETGAVSDVEIYSGLLPEMDEAARAAFSRWKFMPALRDGKPVAVDILIGILPTLPGTQ